MNEKRQQQQENAMVLVVEGNQKKGLIHSYYTTNSYVQG